MKKKIFLVAAIVLLLSIVGYGTLAYTTVEGTATNVITSGGVHIALVETTDDGSPFVDVHGVWPGAVESKIVNVTNTGAHAAWIRVAVDVAIDLAQSGTPDLSLVHLDFNTTDWKEQDGYYYYQHPLAPGETTKAPLFTTVTFDASMDNMYQNSTATVSVQALATQVQNNGETVWEANGWPAES